MDERQDGLTWASQPLTRQLQKVLVDEKRKALQAWADLSGKSTDPRVTAVFARYAAIKEQIALMTRLMGSDGEEDES